MLYKEDTEFHIIEDQVGDELTEEDMPITYYVIGALLQFILLSMIRFIYRIANLSYRS